MSSSKRGGRQCGREWGWLLMPWQYLSIQPRGGLTIIAVSKAAMEVVAQGGYSAVVARELIDEFGRAAAEATGGVVVDVRDTEYLTGATVALLLRFARTSTKLGKPPVVCGSAGVKEVCDICRL